MRAIFQYGPLVLGVITCLAFLLPCRIGIKSKLAWAVVILLASCRNILCYTYTDSTAMPDWPLWIVWILHWLYAAVTFLFFLSILWWGRRARQWVLPVIAAALAGWGVHEAARIPEVREVTIRYAKLPDELEGYRIVQLADLHASSSARFARTEAIVRRANALKPDLICLTGDYVDGRPRVRAADIVPLGELRAKDGVYAVTGNHEYYVNFNGWKSVFDRLGLRFLVNECVFPRKSLALAGVDDIALLVARKHPRTDVRHTEGETPSVAKAFARATHDEFRLLLQHMPRHARDNVANHGVDLQLSGHTHGGMVPGLDLIVRNANRGFLKGLYDLGRGKLYVSPGIGIWSGFPVRIFDPSEITLIVLKKGRE